MPPFSRLSYLPLCDPFTLSSSRVLSTSLSGQHQLPLSLGKSLPHREVCDTVATTSIQALSVQGPNSRMGSSWSLQTFLWSHLTYLSQTTQFHSKPPIFVILGYTVGFVYLWVKFPLKVLWGMWSITDGLNWSCWSSCGWDPSCSPCHGLMRTYGQH